MGEDQQTIDLVLSCTTAISNEDPNSSYFHHQDQTDEFQPWIHPPPASDFRWDVPADQSRLYAASLDLFSDPKNDDGLFDTQPMPSLDDMINGGGGSPAVVYQQAFAAAAQNLQPSLVAESVSREIVHDKDSLKAKAAGRADSVSEGSDPGDDDDENRPVGKSGKRGQSKNLVAERKRRKKLNDRLYSLRSLVPKITKMDRASILGDAIDYIIELEKQVKDLQDELEETNPEDDGAKGSNNNSNCQLIEVSIPNGLENEDSPNSARNNNNNTMVMTNNAKQQNYHEPSSNEDKGHEMEPQVEVRQVEGNEFFLKVLCEQKQGGFVRLMEAMSSLGLEVTNANVTTHKPLVLNVFRVMKQDSELVQAEQVRDSLLEVTRDSNGRDYNHHHHHHSLQYLNHYH
ncbi:transcription factor ABORTED MICROSPORES-like [Typha latifolia]|uniref:transcription factor ABORTED MICROSPORES-like n=1 Tax=Typha latifolia TaxID=4733 RepID=UPI003C2B9FE1